MVQIRQTNLATQSCVLHGTGQNTAGDADRGTHQETLLDIADSPGAGRVASPGTASGDLYTGGIPVIEQTRSLISVTDRTLLEMLRFTAARQLGAFTVR